MYNFIYNMNSKNKLEQTIKRTKNIKGTLNRGTIPEKLIEAKTVSLFSQPFLDTYNQCYKNIVVVNSPPCGPLAELVKFIKFPPLSEFKQQGTCSKIKQCGYALMSLSGCCDNLMVVDEVPDLISYLISNGYTVDTSMTKMFNTSEIRFDTNIGNKLICFITYKN
jgi:hypothetical protein